MKKKTENSKPLPAATSFNIPEIKLGVIKLNIIGDTPLLMHRFADKAKKEMLAKQQKKPNQGKKIRNPKEEYLAALYLDARKKPCFPAVAFKNAAVDACSHLADITKVVARGAFHIIGETVPIYGKPRMREDMVRIGMGTSDLRYRPEFPKWKTEFEVRYNIHVLSPAQIITLFDTAGFAIGVGDWRPQKDGSFGMFHVAR